MNVKYVIKSCICWVIPYFIGYISGEGDIDTTIQPFVLLLGALIFNIIFGSDKE